MAVQGEKEKERERSFNTTYQNILLHFVTINFSYEIQFHTPLSFYAYLLTLIITWLSLSISIVYYINKFNFKRKFLNKLHRF